MRAKLAIAALATACACVGVSAVVAWAAAGTPEVDRANATLSVKGNLGSVNCTGEDKMPYRTFTGSWSGTETQVGLPSIATDYTLSGGVSVTGINWTINLTTGRGLLTGAISLLEPTGAPIYSGGLILVTQGVPTATAPPVPARGWINATVRLPDEGAVAEDRLLANVEFKVGLASATGQFGDVPASLGFKDYSVVTNVPADGVC